MSPSVIVTGAGRGIGAATCDVLGRHGWQVIPLDRSWSGAAPPDAMTVDLGDPAAIDTALSGLDGIHGLVNNAALQLSKSIAETTAAEWDAVHAVNVRAAFLCTRALLGPLSGARGAVVNVASVHATATTVNVAAYAASKGALVAFTRAAAVELASAGIRVNAVVPGAIDTPMLRAGLDRRDRVRGPSEPSLEERTPLRRIGQPREVGEAVAFLLDPDRAGFVTGEALTVDGGALARLSTE